MFSAGHGSGGEMTSGGEMSPIDVRSRAHKPDKHSTLWCADKDPCSGSESNPHP